jgi:hypothetical protein
MTEVMEMVEGEDLDPLIRKLYLSPDKPSYDDIALGIGHSRAYVIARISRMKKRGELAASELRSPRRA